MIGNLFKRVIGGRGPDIVRTARPEEVVIAQENPLIEDNAPPVVHNAPDHLIVGDTYMRVFYIQEWPKALAQQQWWNLLTKKGYFWWSLHVQPIPPSEANRQIERERTAMGATMLLRQRAQMNDSPVMQDTMASLIQEQERVGFYGEPLCYVTTTVTITAPNLATLNELSEELSTGLAAAGIRFYVGVYEQLQGMFSALPFGENTMGSHRRNVTPRTLAWLMPMFNEEILMPGGLFYGVDVTNEAAIMLNPFMLQNPNVFMIGIPGAGKSFTLKHICTQAVLRQARVFIVDIEGEYRALAKHLNGVYLDMTAKSEHKINVLDLDLNSDNPFADSYHAFKSWMLAVLGRDMTAAEDRALDIAYKSAFEARGIYQQHPATYSLPAPQLSDLCESLKALRTHYADEPTIAEASAVLYDALYSMAEGIYRDEFNCASNINIGQANLVVFGLKNVAQDILPKRIRQVQIWITNQMLRDLKHKYVVYDEAWIFFRYPEIAKHLEAEARRYRKKAAALYVATQNVGDFISSQAAETVMRLADTRIFFKQNPSSVDELSQIAKLTPEEKEILPRLNPGQFLLHTGAMRRLCRLDVPPAMYSLYTTKPHEVAAAEH